MMNCVNVVEFGNFVETPPKDRTRMLKLLCDTRRKVDDQFTSLNNTEFETNHEVIAIFKNLGLKYNKKQHDALAFFLKNFETKTRSFVSSPCGSGKTVNLLTLAHLLNKKIKEGILLTKKLIFIVPSKLHCFDIRF